MCKNFDYFATVGMVMGAKIYVLEFQTLIPDHIRMGPSLSSHMGMRLH